MLNPEEYWEEELIRLLRHRNSEKLTEDDPPPTQHLDIIYSELALNKLLLNYQIHASARVQSKQINEVTTNQSSASLHCLWPQIDKVVEEQVALARSDVGEGGWNLFAKDGVMKMYRRQALIDGVTLEPLKAVHTVKGITAHEVCHYFFSPQYRFEWETSLDQMEIVEEISDDTIVFYQVHKRMWPTSQRDSLFWSHIRRLDNNESKVNSDCWTVINYTTENPEYPPSASKFIRIFLSACLLCETVVNSGTMEESVSRDDLTCNIIYSSVVNPGGRTPAAILRVIYKREYPKFLKKFTEYVVRQTQNKPIMF